MIQKCSECGAIVGKDILGLPHHCKLRDKFLKNLNDKLVEVKTK